MASTKHYLAVLAFICSSFAMQAQDFMMQGFYWQYQALFGTQNYAQNLQGLVPDMKEAGFTYLWLPPLSRGAGGRTSTGYDVMDYYDIGEYNGATRFGSRTDVNNIIRSLHSNGMRAVADIIFNHRSGGAAEVNTAVQGWIENYTAAKVSAGDNPYPSDRFQCYILLGGNSGNVSGTYYVKIRSASQSANFYNFPYTFQMWTHKVPMPVDTNILAATATYEYEPNDGGSCGSAPGDTSNQYLLATEKFANVDNGGCGVDEFRLKLDTSMFNTSGDTLFISLANTGAQSLSAFSDQYVHGIYYDALATDLYSQVQYTTNTDFTHMPSGKGGMNWSNFKPNGAATQLSGDWDEMLFYYDVDQNVSSTQSVLTDFTEWMFDSVGIDGIRLDAVKNYPYYTVSQVLDTLNLHNHNPGMVVGEYYDYDASNLTGYIANVKNGMSQAALSSINVRVFDFALRGALKSACDQYGYDERNLFAAGMVNGVGGAGANAVTFVNNLDFRGAGQAVENNPELAYAYILSNNFIGIPCVYYLDYFSTNFMRGRIKGMMHANERWIQGSTSIDYLSRFNSPYTQSFTGSQLASTTVIYQQQNPVTNEDVIVAINFAGDTLDVYQQVNMANLAVGDTFTDIFGVAKPPLLTAITPNNELHVMLPPRSFTVYVKGNHADSLISLGDTLPAPVDTVVTTSIAPVKAATDFAKISPNPFSAMIMVAMGDANDAVVAAQITDITGRVVYTDSGTAHGGKLVLNPSIENAGIYFLKLSAADRSETYKIVKQ